MTTNNHPAHGPVSLERLHQIREILSKAAAQSDGGNLGYAMADAVKVIDEAIAAFGAEPVPCPKCNDAGIADSGGVQPWGETILIECDCRAAMLQAEPVSNRDELPLDYLQGQKDGLEWAAQLAEANHPQTGDWLYDDPIELARAIRKGPDMPTSQAGNSPVIPDGLVMVPKKLTAENGAKSVLSGEFSETKFINCPECFGDDDCETCDGSGRIEITVPVTWTTIKAIWAKGVEHFAAAPQQEVQGE